MTSTAISAFETASKDMADSNVYQLRPEYVIVEHGYMIPGGEDIWAVGTINADGAYDGTGDYRHKPSRDELRRSYGYTATIIFRPCRCAKCRGNDD
jgi:hypothetical protein